MWICKKCGNEDWFKLVSKKEQDVVFYDDGTINYDCLGYEKQRDMIIRCECGNEGKNISDIADWKEEE